MSEGKRVLLIKPGDILIFGNVGDVEHSDMAPALTKLREVLGIEQVFVFAENIDMDSIPAQ